MRKPVCGVCDQVRHKPACAATETSYSLKILNLERRGIILSRQRTTKVLIRLRGCTGWSAPLLFAYGKNRFSHDGAHIILTFMCTTCAGHIVSIWMIAWMFSWKTLPRLILLQGAQVFFITNLLLLEARRHLYRQKFYRCSEIGSMPWIAHIQIYHSISEHLISAHLLGGLCMLPLHDVALDDIECPWHCANNCHTLVQNLTLTLFFKVTNYCKWNKIFIAI